MSWRPNHDYYCDTCGKYSIFPKELHRCNPMDILNHAEYKKEVAIKTEPLVKFLSKRKEQP